MRLLLLPVIVRDLAANIFHPQHVAEKVSFTWRRVKETTNLDDPPHEMGEQQEQDLVMGKGMMTTAAQHQIKKKK